MNMQARLESLHKRHAALEKELHDLMVGPGAADGEIAELKRRKLMIKDEITRLERRPESDGDSSLLNATTG